MSSNRSLIWTVLVGLVCVRPALAEDGLHWESDLPTAQRLAQQTRRLVLIHFGGPWCPPCQRLEHQVFNQPGFGGPLAANYVAVKIDPHQDPATAKKYGIEKVPTDVITTARGQLVYKISPVPASAGAYVEHMNRLASMVQPPAELTAGVPPLTASTTSAVQPTTALRPEASPPSREFAETAARPPADADSGPPRASGNPPLAMDGFCPVTLVEKRKWSAGDPRWGAIHRGRTYLFAGPQEQQSFLATPDRYAPVLNGIDPVMAFDHQQELTGKREFGVFVGNRVYLFSSEASRRQFQQNPARYAAAPRQARSR